jgi:hypothetical protein
MLFNLILLIACVASRADKMEMINSYLDQMTARVGYSVNYALDKAFAETASGSDLEIYALKKDVIAQAQSMFRPLAKNILVDSLQPRLQKRAAPEESYNMRFSGMAKNLFLGIRDRLIKAWNYIFEKLNLKKVREWFANRQSKTGASTENAAKVEGAEMAGKFQRFKTTLLSHLSGRTVAGVIGVSFLSYIIYALFFKNSKVEESDDYFD